VLPIDAGTSPETLRSHTLQVGKRLGDAAAEKPPIAATALTISLDSTFIRSRDDGERHLEVRVGNVETVDGGRQVFGAVTRAETDITALIKRTLETVGRTDATEVTAFTDGCPGLRAILANAGVMRPPVLDWFHIAMRLQHTKQAASEHSQGVKGVASRKLWHALHAVDKYLRGQAAWLVNYAKRQRAGLRVGTSITEGTANFLVNRRMKRHDPPIDGRSQGASGIARSDRPEHRRQWHRHVRPDGGGISTLLYAFDLNHCIRRLALPFS
jgi:hypothetical protein